MDFYPEDLLVGVHPLVFAVDAIEQKDDESKRSLFSRFLDAVAASLVEEEETQMPQQRSLFRADSESDDDCLEEFSSRRRSAGLSFGTGSPTNVNKVEYAKNLSHGGFFQEARIVSISAKSGFPPSKDPEGTENLTHNLRMAIRKKQLPQLFHQYPLVGILPVGWMEKHVHALPSVILVVCTVSSVRSEQEVQDKRLYDTISHLFHSLVPKRKCTVQVIGLLLANVMPNVGDVWSRSVAQELQPSSGESLVHISVLRASTDLPSNDMPSSPALRRLHRKVRDASRDYYMGQARRTKAKLTKLRTLRRQSTPPLPLLPLVIRYYFKVAIFHEFQRKHERSLRFLNEGYRYVVEYYQYLLSGRRDVDEEEEEYLTDDDMPASIPGVDEGVEISLRARRAPIHWNQVVTTPPNDMKHQCRAVAEWMNLKILSACLSSRTESGLVAAASQWRQHLGVFGRRKRITPSWFELQYTCRQNIVFTQLLERYPPLILPSKERTRQVDEDAMQCSPWRTFLAATEMLLQLTLQLEKVESNKKRKADPNRPPFVGGLGSDSLDDYLAVERGIDHNGKYIRNSMIPLTIRVSEKAHDCVRKAIKYFEEECEREGRGFYAEDDFMEQSASRTAARMYYLSGGILLRWNRHSEAVTQLTKATKYAHGWKELELSIRRMLIQCYEKHIPSHEDVNENSETLASIILDSYFNASMSSDELRNALDHFSKLSGGSSLKWYHQSVDEDDTSLPFSFAVSFPDRTHATAGDTVQASVVIRSNLDYAVHVNKATLLSLAGELAIDSNDMMAAANASEGNGNGIIIQAKTVVSISTELVLPRDTALIATNESGNGGELQGTAGKGSFASSAKPRVGGITAAGGARLVAEKTGEEARQSQGWNISNIGGKPLVCDGIKLLFYPVQSERLSSDNVTMIELTIRKIKPKTNANIKRTPFEEENYITSAWSRPEFLPLSKGPSSIRVSAPRPHLVVSNLTDAVTHNKAVEGTVNRIALNLQAGAEEKCLDLKVQVTCFSSLVTPSGTIKRLATETTDGALDMTTPHLRTPVLVSGNESESRCWCSDNIPTGWFVESPTGQALSEISLGSLDRGASSCFSFDLFRPTSSLVVDEDVVENPSKERVADMSTCKTDFYVTISYRQERPQDKNALVRNRRRSKRQSLRKPLVPKGQESLSDDKDRNASVDSAAYDDVSLEYNGSVSWVRPLGIKFQCHSNVECQSGSRHPSNAVGYDRRTESEFATSDGGTVVALCSIELGSGMDSIPAKVESVAFTVRMSIDVPIQTHERCRTIQLPMLQYHSH